MEQKSWRWEIVPLIVAFACFLVANSIWSLSRGLSTSLLGTAIGLAGLFFAEITYARRRHRLLKETGLLLFLWWLFIGPVVLWVHWDATGLYRLMVLAAGKLGLNTQAAGTIAWYVAFCSIIPVGFFQLRALGKTRLSR